MKVNLIGAGVVVAAFLLGPPSVLTASADDTTTTHKLGDHPAVVVQRLNKTAGYDYASKFYPHPAWMYLYAAPPAETADAVATTERDSTSTPPAKWSLARESAHATPQALQPQRN